MDTYKHAEATLAQLLRTEMKISTSRGFTIHNYHYFESRLFHIEKKIQNSLPTDEHNSLHTNLAFYT